MTAALTVLHSFANLGKTRQTRVAIAIFLSSVISGWCANPGEGDAGSAIQANKRSDSPKEAVPVTARDFFNAGTRRLQDGKLKEAEALLETALAKQMHALQPGALYNLGHIRYSQGIEELKRSMSAGSATGIGNSASTHAGEAIKFADEALAGDEIEKLVAAYVNGRGRRKELKAATEAVKQALQAHGNALRKWERSSGDFKSAEELNPPDQDARHNAEVVDRSIAQLVDSLRQMQQAAAMMGAQSKTLGEKMKQLKGRIPASQMPPGAPGDEEEEEENPLGKNPDQKEGASRDGKEMDLSPEQASWMLEGFKLGDKRLPMAIGEQGNPKNRTGSTW